MKTEEIEIYVCPETRTPLRLESANVAQGEVISGQLTAEGGREYQIRDGIPDFTFPPELAEADAQARAFYDERAEAYDQNLHLTFRTHGEDEQKVRRSFIDALELNPSCRVLEVSCGTGRDSEIIAERLGRPGQLCVQDIAYSMLERCRQRLAHTEVPTSFCLSNACYLPYPDKYFDAVYSFGGLGNSPISPAACPKWFG